MSVGLIDLYAAFLIFGIGCGISLIVFILELIVKYGQLKTSHSLKWNNEEIVIYVTRK